MTGTKIPNGFVIAGPDGKPLLIDFDENGVAQESGYALDLPNDWIPSVRPGGVLREDVLVLVHYIEGEQYLVKALESNTLTNGSDAITVFELADRKLLKETAEEIWKRYVDSLVGIPIRRSITILPGTPPKGTFEPWDENEYKGVK